VGLSAATYIEGAWPGSRGLGLAGCIAVNLAAAALIATVAGLGLGAETRRGRVALWLLASVLLVLALFEISGA
jgi:hypothetical protein